MKIKALLSLLYYFFLTLPSHYNLDLICLLFFFQVIEPQFQRDFISLLPKELALNVLSFLEPKDLLRAAQACRSWRFLADDNFLWKDKCRKAGIDISKKRVASKSSNSGISPWKVNFIYISTYCLNIVSKCALNFRQHI